MNLAAILNPPEDSPVDTGGIYGVVIGIVTNTKDDENRGRIKLRFPWLSDNDECYLARIAVPMAGEGRGTYFLPEVDDEVLVVFEHGDINRPYIIGSLWSAKYPPPSDNADGKNNIKQIVSRSGHRVMLDDTDGDEKIEIIDKSGGNKICIHTKDNRLCIDSAGDINLNAGGAVNIKSQELNMETSAAVNIKAGASLDMASSNAVTINGANINSK